MVIPVGDLNPVRRSPWVMRLLILANLGVFLFAQPWLDGRCAVEQFFLRWGAIPLEVVRGAPLAAAEMVASPCTLAPVTDKPVAAAVVSSMFLHADLWHLLGNMLFLWIFGNNVEDRFGHVGFTVFYLAGGVAAAAVFIAANPEAANVLVGASGAIAAVLGAYLVLYPLARVQVVVLPLFFLTFRVPAVLVLGLWFLLQLRDAGTEMVGGGGVAYLAHVAGFVAGAAVTILLGFRPQRPERPQRTRRRRRPPPPAW